MLATTAEIVTADPRQDSRWRDLAIGPHSGLFISPPWIRAICATFGFEPEARIALDGTGRPVGGFTWIPIADFRGSRLCSLPFSDWADPPAGSEPLWSALLDGALTSGIPLTLRCLRAPEPLSDPRLRIAGEAAWHGTRLDVPIDELRRHIPDAAKRGIAAAERRGVRVEASTGLDYLHRFHRLHLALRKRKYRLLAQPVEFFDRMWQEFAPYDSVVTLLAFVDDWAVAGMVLLVWNDTLYCKFVASLPEYLQLRPNDAVYWNAIRWGAERGLRLLDWGRSDLDQPGLIQYKNKWATEQRRITTLRSADRPAFRPEADMVLNELTRLLTDESVPDEITAEASSLLYRYFC